MSPRDAARPYALAQILPALTRVKPDFRMPDDPSSDVNLASAGFDSLAIVQLLTVLEDDLGIEFPDEFIRRETFRSAKSVLAALNKIAEARGQ